MQSISRRIHIDTAPSTNTLARQLLEQGELLPDLTVIDTEYQPEGRGQRGNSWESERGKNLTFSIVCHPRNIIASRQYILSQSIALAICQTLSRYTSGISIKWPNDIYWNDQKISGTLIECDLRGKYVENCIIGSGININQTTFTSDAPNPVSLSMITGKEYNLEDILQETVDNFMSIYQQISEGHTDDIISKYSSHLYRRHGFHSYQEPGGQPFEAEIVEVEPTGHLHLRRKDGTEHRYEFKEVRFII